MTIDNDIETWKDVVGYKGLYKISNFGRVWGIKRNKKLQLVPDKDGYYVVGLSKAGNRP